MGACYAPSAHFRDAVFDLHGPEVPAMWRMLCERGKDLRVEFRDVRVDGNQGTAHWEAWYTFSATGRRVHNVIDASFRLEQGRIVEHIDRFDFHRWAAQALGPAGRLFGWAPPFRHMIQRRAAKGLTAFMALSIAACASGNRALDHELSRYNTFVTHQAGDSIAAMFAPDGELVMPGATLRGPAQIARALALFTNVRVDSSAMHADSVIRTDSGMVQWGRFYQRATVTGQEPVEASGKFVALWVRDAAGHWKVRRLATY